VVCPIFYETEETIIAVNPYTLLDKVNEHGAALRLYQRGFEFSIYVEKEGELMNSRLHNSEDVLAEIACKHVGKIKSPHLMIGGLGMGFTLRAALNHAKKDAKVTVVELSPSVIKWNREHLGHLADFPLQDARVDVLEDDVGKVMKRHKDTFDAIMLDVDNGPDGFTRQENDVLYGYNGLTKAYESLKQGGVFTVWSAASDKAFTQRLKKVGFEVREQTVRAINQRKGAKHHIWIAVRC